MRLNKAIAQAEKVQADIGHPAIYAVLAPKSQRKRGQRRRRSSEEREATKNMAKEGAPCPKLTKVTPYQGIPRGLKTEQKGADTTCTRYYEALITEERRKQAEERKVKRQEAAAETKRPRNKTETQKLEQEWNDKLFKATADRITILEKRTHEQIRIARELRANGPIVLTTNDADELDRQARSASAGLRKRPEAPGIWQKLGHHREHHEDPLMMSNVSSHFNVEQDL